MAPSTAAELGLMYGSPLAPDKRVTLVNWQNPAFNGWGSQHVDAFVPTATISRGHGWVAKVVDAQSGHEKTLTGLLTALAGANLIYGAGMLETAMTIDCGQLVMDAEIAGLIKYCLGGVPVNGVTLALDVINEVGPFRTSSATRTPTATCASSRSRRLIDRRVREEWAAGGATDVASAPAPAPAQILATHVPTPLPEGAAEEMAAIVKDAESHLGCETPGAMGRVF